MRSLPKIIFIHLAIAFTAILMVYLVGKSMDESFDNKDTMLCNSAKVSGNIEYLNKCSCFYAGENIRCIYKEEK